MLRDLINHDFIRDRTQNSDELFGVLNDHAGEGGRERVVPTFAPILPLWKQLSRCRTSWFWCSVHSSWGASPFACSALVPSKCCSPRHDATPKRKRIAMAKKMSDIYWSPPAGLAKRRVIIEKKIAELQNKLAEIQKLEKMASVRK
jgi:hypothetical protein